MAKNINLAKEEVVEKVIAKKKSKKKTMAKKAAKFSHPAEMSSKKALFKK